MSFQVPCMHFLHFNVSTGSILKILLNVIVVLRHLLLSSHLVEGPLLCGVDIGNRECTQVLTSLGNSAEASHLLLVFFVFIKVIVGSTSSLGCITENTCYIQPSLLVRRRVTNSTTKVKLFYVLWHVKLIRIDLIALTIRVGFLINHELFDSIILHSTH